MTEDSCDPIQIAKIQASHGSTTDGLNSNGPSMASIQRLQLEKVKDYRPGPERQDRQGVLDRNARLYIAENLSNGKLSHILPDGFAKRAAGKDQFHVVVKDSADLNEEGRSSALQSGEKITGPQEIVHRVMPDKNKDIYAEALPILAQSTDFQEREDGIGIVQDIGEIEYILNSHRVPVAKN